MSMNFQDCKLCISVFHFSKCKKFSQRIGLVLLIVSLGMSGCGRQGGPSRVSVEGIVTVDGQPLKKGTITFVPIKETQGPKAGGVIENGQYHLPKTSGPVIGKLRVEIREEQDFGFDPTEPEEYVERAEKVENPLPSNPIPAKYNDQSKLSIVTSADGQNRFDFDLFTSSANE